MQNVKRKMFTKDNIVGQKDTTMAKMEAKNSNELYKKVAINSVIENDIANDYKKY